MGKYPIYAILTGMLLALASCVPVAGSLYRMAVPDDPVAYELPTSGKFRVDHELGDAARIQWVLVFEVLPRDLDQDGLRYRATVYNGDQVLQTDSGVITRQDVMPQPEASRTGHTVRIEKRLPVLEPANGQESVGLEVELDIRVDPPALAGALAELHPDPPRFAVSFINTVVIWTLGTLLVLIGAIQWGRQVAGTAARTAPGSDDVRDRRLWCMLCHLSALLGYVVPFAHILAPLLIWVSRRSTIPGVDDAGRESLNFQLTVSLFGLVGIMLSAVFIGLVLIFALVVFHFCMTLVAALSAQRGEVYRYPLTLRIIGTAGRKL